MVAALSAAHLAAWKIPAGMRRLIVAADNDRAGQNAAHKLADGAKADGVKVQTFVSTGKDFNDDLRRVTREHLLRQLVNHLQ
jgi:DNA primase